MSKKIGFWALLSIVIGSQVGSSVFMSPANLAPFGYFSFIGWVISGLGALSLSFVFSSLGSRIPRTGGPHAFVEEAFGRHAAFFTGWTYWVVSWVSTTAVISTATGYLVEFIGQVSPNSHLAIEVLLLLAIMILNMFGILVAGKAEFWLTLLKFIPLALVPLVALFYFNINNFQILEVYAQESPTSMIAKVTMLTMWGFIGVESGTTPAGSVENPQRTIPRAIFLGTLSVLLIYLFNHIGISGLIPAEKLAVSKAPYVDVAKILFGGKWYLLIALIGAIVCVGTLNAWVITSSQIAYGLSLDKYLPQIFSSKNKHGAPWFSVLSSCVGILPMLLLTANDNIADQIKSIIDISVTSFLFVYLICSFALIKITRFRKDSKRLSDVLAIVACLFCAWVIYETPIKILILSMLFTLSGAFIYFFSPKKFQTKGNS